MNVFREATSRPGACTRCGHDIHSHFVFYLLSARPLERWNAALFLILALLTWSIGKTYFDLSVTCLLLPFGTGD